MFLNSQGVIRSQWNNWSDSGYLHKIRTERRIAQWLDSSGFINIPGGGDVGEGAVSVLGRELGE